MVGIETEFLSSMATTVVERRILKVDETNALRQAKYRLTRARMKNVLQKIKDLEWITDDRAYRKQVKVLVDEGLDETFRPADERPRQKPGRKPKLKPSHRPGKLPPWPVVQPETDMASTTQSPKKTKKGKPTATRKSAIKR
jgi:hypothetical protein